MSFGEQALQGPASPGTETLLAWVSPATQGLPVKPNAQRRLRERERKEMAGGERLECSNSGEKKKERIGSRSGRRNIQIDHTHTHHTLTDWNKNIQALTYRGTSLLFTSIFTPSTTSLERKESCYCNFKMIKPKTFKLFTT